MRALLLALLLSGAASAESPAQSCTDFAWPMTREMAAFGTPPAGLTASGAALNEWPVRAVTLSLRPGGETAFPLPPERAPKDGTQAGAVTLPAPAAGLYQVTLSGKAWIDIVQNGAPVKSGAHTSDPDCPLMRKSVRFDLVAAPVTLQISGSDATTVTFTILPATE